MSRFNEKVFEDTRIKSTTIFSNDTDTLKNNTIVVPAKDEIISDTDLVLQDNMQIKVVHGGTVSTSYKLKNDNNRIAMLNFADAKRPGGWVVEGAYTQEENMCRCTNLYETLIQPKCIKDYYRVNLEFGVKDAEQHYNEPYTDTLIYSENVAIFKDDQNYKDIPVKYVDVITCPAPCGYVKNTEKILKRRMRRIFKIAYTHNVTHLVLGAWGCGAFGQNPEIVASCFNEVLKELPVFKYVIFAILDSRYDFNYEVFKEILM